MLQSVQRNVYARSHKIVCMQALSMERSRMLISTLGVTEMENKNKLKTQQGIF